MRNRQNFSFFILTFAPLFISISSIFMHMKIFHIAIVAMLLFAGHADAQVRSRHAKVHDADTVPVIVRSYVDSLQVGRTRVDSLFALRRDSLSAPDGRYYRLFVPFTFYHGIAANAFRLGDSIPELDRSLLDVYLHRPDLVVSTQSQLDRVGPIIEPSTTPVKPETDIVDLVSPKVDDDDVVSPVQIYVEKPNFWKFSGDYSLQLFQNYVSDNWYKGGESNYSLIAAVTLQANYNNKQRFQWNNKLEMRLGLQNSRGDTLHTVRASGLQASKHWYYTFQLIASTQFMRGLRSNDTRIYSRFLSPLYVNPSLGMDYKVNWFKGRMTGSVHLAPIAYSLTYARDKDLAPRFGIDEGHHAKNDYGSEVTVDLVWQMAKDIRWKTRFYGYTTYHRMKMEWENTFTFVVNKYISTNLFLYPRFDDGVKRDDKYGYFQFKEYVSLGFSYGI